MHLFIFLSQILSAYLAAVQSNPYDPRLNICFKTWYPLKTTYIRFEKHGKTFSQTFFDEPSSPYPKENRHDFLTLELMTSRLHIRETSQVQHLEINPFLFLFRLFRRTRTRSGNTTRRMAGAFFGEFVTLNELATGGARDGRQAKSSRVRPSATSIRAGSLLHP